MKGQSSIDLNVRSKARVLRGQFSIKQPLTQILRQNLSTFFGTVDKPAVAARCLKGQSSMELLVTFSTVLVFTVPVLLLLLTVSQFGFERSSVVQADSSARVIADNLNELSAQGEGAKRELLLNLPSNTKYIHISKGEVVIGVSLSTGIYEAAAPFYANVVTPYDTAVSGLYPLSMEWLYQTNEVHIS